MSEDDRGTKPPTRPGAGASGTPGSIGKALGGDLDFEPDALLDSLMQDEPKPAPAPRRPRVDSQPPLEAELTPAELDSNPPEAGETEHADRETLRPEDPDDEEPTLIGHRDQLFEGGHLPAPPGRGKLPAGPDSSTATPLMHRPPPSTQSIPGRRVPGGLELRQPPAAPRPAAGSPAIPRPTVPRPQPPAVPRPQPPAVPPPSSPEPREPMLSETSISTVPPPALDVEEDDAPESQRTSLTHDEIAALDELESLSPPSDSEPPTESRYVPPLGTLPKISSPPTSVSFGQSTSSLPPSLRPSSQPARSLSPVPRSSSPPRPSAPGSRAASQAPRLQSQAPRVEPGATLPKPGHPDEWTQRAEWIEAEARRVADAPGRSRALVVASEIWALAGNLERARTAAQDANTAAKAGMAGRQLRWLAAAAGDWKLVANTLELELRATPPEGARAHASYLDAEVQRLCLADDAGATQRFDAALRAEAEDPRPHLAKLGSALGASAEPAAHALPDSIHASPLGRALEQSRELRAGTGDPAGQAPAAAFGIARRALERADRLAAAGAFAAIGKVDGLGDGAAWLATSLLAEEPSARDEALRRTTALATGADPKLGRRALAWRALELRDNAALTAALEPADDTFSPAERLAIAALTGDSEAVQAFAGGLTDGEYAALAAAALAANGQATPEAGSDESRAEATLGRAVAKSGADVKLERLAPSVQRFAETHPGTVLANLLTLELATVERRHAEVAAALGAWGDGTGEQPPTRDRSLARALVSELAGDLEDARAAYAEAGEADPSFEAALRARLAVLDDEGRARALAELATASHDSTHGAVLLLEAALEFGAADTSRTDEWLKRAITLEPALSIAFRVGEQQARSVADADRLAEWLRARREVTNDDVERSLDLVREALLIADTQPAEAQALLEGAIQAHPGDVGLRELHERLGTSTHGVERGAWREAAAEHASDATRVLLELQAAFEYERAGDRANAARLAARAATAGGALARLTAERTAAGTPEAARVSEELLNRARAATDPREQRELYEALSDLDRQRGDSASVVLWQTAILEQSPHSLPALRELEHAYATSSRDEELEPVSAALARLLPDLEGFAHARIAARLRSKAGAWASQRELVELAAELNPGSIWALRALAAHARAADEPEKAMDAHQRLQALVEHPLDKATLALRGAEAAARLGRFEQAKSALEACLALVPDHWVGLTTLSEVLEALRDYAGAARALEAVAESSTVDAHRVSAWHQAAVLWLDKVTDVERGRAALEHAIALDPEHEDAMARLQQLLIEQGDRQALAQVLGRRLELATDPEERIALEVQRGKLLAGVGEHAAARSALTAALDANPEHAGALEALADLCAAEGDWSGAEQALIRLARHAPEPARQAQIYRRLGELYDTNLPNPERAELAYQEVLKREPDDAPATLRLVQIAGQLGQANRAIELQQGLVDRAKTPAEKRDRTLGLGLVLEQIAKDKKRADAVFERARKDWPQDTSVLRAAVEYHRRAGEQRAAQVLVDRAATDARRALATGRFDPILFEVLGAVAELRGASDSALVAEATLAALAGRPLAVHGAGNTAARPELDELLAPEVITPALRTLLERTGDVLDQAYGLDARTLRAQPLPAESGALGEQARELAAAFGVQGLEVLVSPVLGATCLATRSVPPQIVYGTPLIERGDDATRYFLLVRALKLIQTRAATLARTVPTELGPVVAGFLSALADYNPEGVDPKRLADAQKRVKAAIGKPLGNDIPMLALEVVGSLGSRSSQLATALNQWANRTALLAVGSPLTAVRALALSSNAELPAEGADRLRWLGRHAEARDLAIFSVTEAYGEARKRLGVVG
jgi:tetratricopeptide (TPR) repeat protein